MAGVNEIRERSCQTDYREGGRECHSSSHDIFDKFSFPLYAEHQRGRKEGGHYHRGGRGGGRGGGWRGGRGYVRQNPDNRSAGSNSNYIRTSYKYDSEFDFESANARFKKEDLELEFKHKLRVTDDPGKNSEGSGQDLEVEPSDEEEVIVEEGEELKVEEEFYDKTKSFFDNISCEGKSGANRLVSHLLPPHLLLMSSPTFFYFVFSSISECFHPVSSTFYFYCLLSFFSFCASLTTFSPGVLPIMKRGR